MSDAFIGSRESYTRAVLNREDLTSEPSELLRTWLQAATDDGVIEPNAMCLSTVGPDGQPSSRMVLLRGLSSRGLTFFTNYLSRKGLEIDANPRACVTFWWGSLERQVRVEGILQRVSSEESDAYFASRPRGSQAASAVSPQSQPLVDRADLEASIARLAEDESQPIRRPDHWGGYLLVPARFEFWQGRPARVHDRWVYERHGDEWLFQRLAP